MLLELFALITPFFLTDELNYPELAKGTRSRVLVNPILYPRPSTLTGCRVERGLLEWY